MLLIAGQLTGDGLLLLLGKGCDVQLIPKKVPAEATTARVSKGALRLTIWLGYRDIIESCVVDRILKRRTVREAVRRFAEMGTVS